MIKNLINILIYKVLLLIFISILINSVSFPDSLNTYKNSDIMDAYAKYNYIFWNYDELVKSKSDTTIINFMDIITEKITQQNDKRYLLFIDELYRICDGYLSEELFVRFAKIYKSKANMVFEYMYKFRAKKEFIKELFLLSLIDEIRMNKDPELKKKWTISFLMDAIKQYEKDKYKKAYFNSLLNNFNKQLDEAPE